MIRRMFLIICYRLYVFELMYSNNRGIQNRKIRSKAYPADKAENLVFIRTTRLKKQIRFKISNLGVSSTSICSFVWNMWNNYIYAKTRIIVYFGFTFYVWKYQINFLDILFISVFQDPRYLKNPTAYFNSEYPSYGYGTHNV